MSYTASNIFYWKLANVAFMPKPQCIMLCFQNIIVMCAGIQKSNQWCFHRSMSTSCNLWAKTIHKYNFLTLSYFRWKSTLGKRISFRILFRWLLIFCFCDRNILYPMFFSFSGNQLQLFPQIHSKIIQTPFLIPFCWKSFSRWSLSSRFSHGNNRFVSVTLRVKTLYSAKITAIND